MSGSTGASRIESREHFKQFIASYTKIINKFPGFVSLSPSGSYNSDASKTSFGDIDVICHIKSNKSKADVKKDLAKFLEALPDDVIAPFTSPRYNGKRSNNTGEIITVRYHDKKNGYSVQVDNMIALSHDEANFKQQFLDFPAEKQGLILGLVKVASIEEPVKSSFTRLGIKAPLTLPKDEEYEYNLSSIELQLRHVKYVPGTFKQESREVIWHTQNFDLVEKLLNKYDLSDTFEGLIKQCKKHLNNPRSNARMKGVFSGMISVKSGEVNTPKGDNKQKAIDKVNSIFGESTMKTFNEYLNELSAQYLTFAKKAKESTASAKTKEDHAEAALHHEYAAVHAPTNNLKSAHLNQAAEHKKYK